MLRIEMSFLKEFMASRVIMADSRRISELRALFLTGKAVICGLLFGGLEKLLAAIIIGLFGSIISDVQKDTTPW